MQAVYSPRFDINFAGLENLHPFDAKKYSRAWARVPELHATALRVAAPVGDSDLLRVHSETYLKALKHTHILAMALEIPLIGALPAKLTEIAVLTPMRFGVAGTILGAQTAVRDNALVFNLSGGYHHAKPESGEGFCLFNDIAIAIALLRADGHEGNIAYIDLDAHQGNGVAHCVVEDRRVWLFDMFNAAIYPQDDTIAHQRIDWPIPLAMLTKGELYLQELKKQLPLFLETVGEIELAIYNAGTDVYAKDQLGGLSLTENDILERDLFVIQTLRAQNVPTLVLPSGGYSDASHRMIANTLKSAWERAC